LTSFRASAGALTLLLLSLTACGGGGGGASAPAASSGVPPALTSTQSALKARARAAAQAALTVYAQAASKLGLGALSSRRHALDIIGHLPVGTSPGCNAARNNSFTQGSVTHPDGSSTETTTVFYDTACKQPELVEVVTAPPAPGPGSTTIKTGSVTAFDRTGATIGVTTFQDTTVTGLAGSAGAIPTITETSVQQTSANAASPPVHQLAFTSTTPGVTGGAIETGLAEVASAGAATSGTSLTISDTVSPTAASSVNTATFSALLFTGIGLGIVRGDGVAWSVFGAAPFDDETAGVVTVNTDTNFVQTGSINLIDTEIGLSINGNITPAGLSVPVKQGATLLASVVTDGSTGTITYADGSSENIANLIIIP